MNLPLTHSNGMIVSKVMETLDKALKAADITHIHSGKISKREWITKILLKHLTQAGKSIGYDVSSDVGGANSSRPHNLMWKEMSLQDKPALVVECELGKIFLYISDDFNKLLSARAGIRLLITYGGEDSQDMERALEIVTKLQNQIQYGNNSQTGYCFLFATIVKDNNSEYVFQYEFVEKY